MAGFSERPDRWKEGWKEGWKVSDGLGWRRLGWSGVGCCVSEWMGGWEDGILCCTEGDRSLLDGRGGGSKRSGWDCAWICM